MSTPTCPKCGASLTVSACGKTFACGTWVSFKDESMVDEARDCIARQRDQLLQKVQRLEEDKDILTSANSQVRRIAMERDEAERRISELHAECDGYMSKATAWKMYADRLEEAGSSLRTAAAVFRLKEIEDNDGRSVLMEDLPKNAGILYDDLPTAGDHVALSEAMNNWTKAKETKP